MNEKNKVKGKKGKKNGGEEDEHAGGASLDDAFADDDDVEYAQSKPRKEKKKKKDKKEKKGGDDELEEELEEAEEEIGEISREENKGKGIEQGHVIIKASKPIIKIKKGDRIRIDGKEYIVDQHYVLIDHGNTKEMAIELYDKDEKDSQLRYFSDQAEATLEMYELQEIMFIKKPIKKIEW